MKVTRVAWLLFKQLRPRQWTKNGLLFAALIFSFQFTHFHELLLVTIGFFLFSFVSGCVYILNDFFDREADRLHPQKKYRPIASGELNAYLALWFGLILFCFSLFIAFYLNPLFCLILGAYAVLNVFYSFKLKHIVIIDVMIIASGFVFRALSGAVLIHVSITSWFFLCTMLLSLFLAISKRRHEVSLLKDTKSTHRKVLANYSLPLLDQMNMIVTSSTLITYSLFTFFSGYTTYLMFTIPFVIYGIFRYLYLIHHEGKGGSPERVLLEDKHILVTVILYVVSTVFLLYTFS